jgi:hypothetical protein
LKTVEDAMLRPADSRVQVYDLDVKQVHMEAPLGRETEVDLGVTDHDYLLLINPIQTA